MTARMIMKTVITEIVRATPDVTVFAFRHPRRPQLPTWTPGAHIDVKLPGGRLRQYSLCGDPADLSQYRIAVKREDAGRGGSAEIHDAFRIEHEVHVSAPRNNFPLATNTLRHVFVAGGIGITPVLPMARQLDREGADFSLHFCARSARDAPLLEDVRAIRGSRLTTWFSGKGQRFSFDAVGPYQPGSHLYACGPQRLLDAVKDGAETAGWPPQQIHAEVFQPTVDENFKPEPFDAIIASTGETIRVAADRSLLDTLRDHGHASASSCELGVCGACICGYRNGIVIHRDVVLSNAERQDRMTPCVSRARNIVTLDL